MQHGGADFLADTIAAVATAPGRSAVALVRVAGPDAKKVLERISPGTGDRLPSRTQRLRDIRHPETGELIDHALVCYFAGPASYTGDDTVEISTHGGLLTPQLVLAATIAAGARQALPGEFTRRAYLNGKLDLVQAEAVLDLIDGLSPALHRAAIHQLDRGLSQRIEELRTAILGVEALLIYSIDFPEEDEPPVPPERVAAEAVRVIEMIEELLRTAPEGELLREGALVVLAGRPNSGKSSLFNALIGAERAIVTEVPGTTRDALEAQITVDGFPFRLVDTAGLRETVDPVEGIGIEVARRYLRAAQVILFCAPAGRALDAEEQAFLADLDAQRILLLRTMIDRVPQSESAGADQESSELAVSALVGTGLDRLRADLLTRAFGAIVGDGAETPLVTRERQTRALRGAKEELEAFLTASGDDVPIEIAAVHLRSAVAGLEELIGAVTTEDLLGRVFGEFCVGK